MMLPNQTIHPCERGHTFQWGSADPCVYCRAPFMMALGQRFRAEPRTADNPALLADPPKSPLKTAAVVELDRAEPGEGTAARPESAAGDSAFGCILSDAGLSPGELTTVSNGLIEVLCDQTGYSTFAAALISAAMVAQLLRDSVPAPDRHGQTEALCVMIRIGAGDLPKDDTPCTP